MIYIYQPESEPMDASAAELIWTVVGAYFGVGFVVAIALVGGLVRRFDPLAAQAPWRVKLILVPGMAALWPLLAIKSLRGAKAP